MRLFSHGRKIAFAFMAALGTVSGTLAMPVVTSSFADAPLCPGTTDPLGNCITSGETTINVNVLPVLGLWLSSTTQQGNTTPFTEDSVDTISTDGKVTPKPLGTSTGQQDRRVTFSVLPGQTATASMNARVMTNVSSGYKLFIEMAGSETALKNTNNQITTQFSKTGGTIASPVANLVDNTWGVKGGDVTAGYIGVPASGSGSTAGLLKTGNKTTSTSQVDGSETTEITFGVKANSAMDSGTYTGTVVITAVVTD